MFHSFARFVGFDGFVFDCERFGRYSYGRQFILHAVAANLQVQRYYIDYSRLCFERPYELW